MKMIDEHQVKRLKKMGYVFSGIMLLLIGYGLGARGKTNDTPKESTKITTKKNGRSKSYISETSQEFSNSLLYKERFGRK
ncbi:hypothetical protein MXZ18_06325 [Streptococcus uberis]|uniref:hypothetical protein n=1 Tax=Streptococcus uberis TaxID=1349 RepID=UPI0027DCF136|nr:hypothetical protein [Streptococcus uberis]MCK1169231.1 hypothetical protein [Streptococcus uberis]MCK1207407.1 hypothetical protein [Streptococcus uberis]MCK1211325.1 hypothetical protein [Streptococcus uberis]MCK1235295.1 hypothetical protein [Streptococcus uberis]MCK1242555.1 hypothetical protein [Streptococcus uberis]